MNSSHGKKPRRLIIAGVRDGVGALADPAVMRRRGWGWSDSSPNAEPAARNVHGAARVGVDRPVVETSRGLDPVNVSPGSVGANLAGDLAGPSVAAVAAEASARNVDAGRGVRVDGAVAEPSRRGHGVGVVHVVAHRALHRGDVARSAHLAGHLALAHPMDAEALGGRRGDGGTAAVSAEADAGDAAVGVHALAPAGLRRVMPVAVGPRRGDLVVRFVPLPAVPTARRRLTAVTIPPRVAVALVLPRAVRITATARLRAVRAHHGDPYADARGLVCLPRRANFSHQIPNGKLASPNAGADCVERTHPRSRGSTDRGGRDHRSRTARRRSAVPTRGWARRLSSPGRRGRRERSPPRNRGARRRAKSLSVRDPIHPRCLRRRGRPRASPTAATRSSPRSTSAARCARLRQDDLSDQASDDALVHHDDSSGWAQTPAWNICLNAAMYCAVPLSMPATLAAGGWFWGTAFFAYSTFATYWTGLVIGRVYLEHPQLATYPAMASEAFHNLALERTGDARVARDWRVWTRRAVKMTQFATFYLDTVTQMIYVAQYFAQLDLGWFERGRVETRVTDQSVLSWSPRPAVGVGARRVGGVRTVMQIPTFPRRGGSSCRPSRPGRLRRAVFVRGGGGGQAVVVRARSEVWRRHRSHREGLAG